MKQPRAVEETLIKLIGEMRPKQGSVRTINDSLYQTLNLFKGIILTENK
jgi:hypothetical protein